MKFSGKVNYNILMTLVAVFLVKEQFTAVNKQFIAVKKQSIVSKSSLHRSKSSR